MSETEASNIDEYDLGDWKELAEKPHEDLTQAELTSKIKLSIRRRYSYPEWAIVYEIGLGNGRVADAIAVGLMPSRNFKVVGFEFKASRSDWLREKKEPEKADEFVQVCDEWYVVAGDTGIINEEEVPEGWGFLELKPNSAQLYKLVESDLTEFQQGEPDRNFWGRFIKKTVGSESNFTKSDLQEAHRRGYEAAKDELTQDRIDRDVKRQREKAEAYDTLRDESPLRIPYDGDIPTDRLKRLQAAEQLIKSIGQDRHTTLQGEIESFRNTAERRLERVIDDTELLLDGLEGIRDELSEVTDTDGGED